MDNVNFVNHGGIGLIVVTNIILSKLSFGHQYLNTSVRESVRAVLLVLFYRSTGQEGISNISIIS